VRVRALGRIHAGRHVHAAKHVGHVHTARYVHAVRLVRGHTARQKEKHQDLSGFVLFIDALRVRVLYIDSLTIEQQRSAWL
jgi:hypothetical protein